MNGKILKRILILSANPKNTDQLRLSEEVRNIEAGLARARKRDQFEIISKWAVRPEYKQTQFTNTSAVWQAGFTQFREAD